MNKSVFDLKKKESARIKYFTNSSIACKLLTVGIIPDAQVVLVQRAPFGGAVSIKLGETVIAIRDKEAKSIIVE